MKTRAGRVTDSERRQALLHDRDRAALEQRGIAAAAQVGWRAQQAALRAFRRGEDPAAAFRETLEAAAPIVAEAMVAGHLTGEKRAVLTVARSAAVAADKTPYDTAVKMLADRSKASQERIDALRRVYQAEALQVLGRTADVVSEKIARVAVQTVAERGEHVRGAVRLFSEVGMTPDNSYTLENLFRTQIQTAYGAGRWQQSQDEAIQEILWGYKYVTVGDDRVRPEHAALDGTVLPKDDPFWRSAWPPNGFSCVPAGTSIVTANGPKPVESVVVGEMVFTHKKRFRPVVQLHRSPGPQEMVAIDRLDGTTLCLTANHRVFTKRGWIEAARLEIGDEFLEIAGLSLAKVPRHVISVSVISVKVKAIRRIPYDGSMVYNLSVLDDESYFADGLAVHNCRCSTIEIFDERKPIRPAAVVEIDGRRIVPGPDKGFRQNAGEMLEDLVPSPVTPEKLGRKYRDVETVQEAEQWARKVALEADYSGLSVQSANQVNRALAEQLRGRNSLDRIVVEDRDEMAAVQGNTLLIDRRTMETPRAAERQISAENRKVRRDKAAGKTSADRFSSARSVQDVVRHESGHVMLERAREAGLSDDEILRSLDADPDNSEGGVVRLTQRGVRLAQRISDYASWNTDQYFAEAWTEYHSGRRNRIPGKVIKLIERVLDMTQEKPRD